MGSQKEGSAGMGKLLLGVAGIYGAFMYYGVMQSAIVKYVSPESGERLGREWFLMTIEAFANVIVGVIGLYIVQGGPSRNIPWKRFATSGTAQVVAKAMTAKAMNLGVPFFIAVLVKNAKMVPVMLGSILLGGKSYPRRTYVQVGLIIAGVVVVSLNKKKKASKGGEADAGDVYGLLCLVFSLICDGLVAGEQTAMKEGYSKTNKGTRLQSYDLMAFTNLAMCLCGLCLSLGLGQFFGGVSFILANPPLAWNIAKFAACSALGQSAIFFTITNFDPLVTSTVTTTRKIFTVLLDIFMSGHSLNPLQWGGIATVTLGVLGELHEKFGFKTKKTLEGKKRA